MGKKDRLLYQMILCAVFAALSFAGTYIHIPMPSGGFVHLGNFICIIAGLLCGGIVGGISGAVGMGIYDIMYYGGFTAGVMRTILLKFGMGMIAGYLFRYLIKKDKNAKVLNYIILGLFTIGFILTLIAAIHGPYPIGSKKFTIHWIVPVFFGAIDILYVFVIIFYNKLPKLSSLALSATAVAISFNIFGEVFVKALLYWIFDVINSTGKYPTFDAAFIYSVSGLPSVLVTSTVTCILCGFIFYPLYMATSRVNKYDDIKEILKQQTQTNEENNQEASLEK